LQCVETVAVATHPPVDTATARHKIRWPGKSSVGQQAQSTDTNTLGDARRKDMCNCATGAGVGILGDFTRIHREEFWSKKFYN